jgi:hypothetical protein
MIVFLFDNLTKVTGINADNLMRETKRHKKELATSISNNVKRQSSKAMLIV